MSVGAVAWALKQPIKDTTTKLLLVVLADFADDENACWPRQSLLAELVGECSVDTVQRHLKVLASDGYLTRERRHLQNGNRASDRYVLSAPKLSRKMRPRTPRTKPQIAALSKPHPDAAWSKPQNCAVARRTTKVEPPVEVGLVDRESPTSNVGASGNLAAACEADSNPTSVPVPQEIAELNGCGAAMVEQLARWENPTLPEPKIAAEVIATQVRVYGAERVKEAYALMAGEMPGGTIRRPLKVFPKICRRMAQEALEDAAYGRPAPKPYPGYFGPGG